MTLQRLIENNELLLPLSDFIKFLKENRRPEDTSTRLDNIQRDLDKKHGLRRLQNTIYIELSAFILYVLSKTTNKFICKNIFNDILHLISYENKPSEEMYVKKLYNNLAKMSSSYKYMTDIHRF